MPNNHPAFRAGEYVKFAELEVIEKLQEQFGQNGPEGRKWIHDFLVTNMTEHAGKGVRIKSVSLYHFGTVLYEFNEVEGCWLEPFIVDWHLEDPSAPDFNQPAHLFYDARTDDGFDQPGMVQIQGVQDKLTYCALRKRHAGREARNITEISRIRTKANFETFYGFDGRHDPIYSE